MDAAANHIWQSTVVAAGAAVLTLLFRREDASVRYWIWFAASIQFLIPFAALTFIWRLLPDAFQTPIADSEAAAAARVLFHSPASSVMTSQYSGLLAATWLTGGMVILARWGWQWRRLRALLREAERVTAGTVYDVLRRVELTVPLRRPVTLVRSMHTLEPGVIGIRHAVLVWPHHLTDRLSESHIEAILTHEVCHISRRDNLHAMAHMLVGAGFWFHPIVWLIGARLVDERERACDERVVSLGQHPPTYAASILKTCEMCIASPLASVAGVTGGNLEKRIMRIMNGDPRSALTGWKMAVLVLAALLALFVPIAAGIDASAANATPPHDSDASEARQAGGDVQLPRLLREVKPHYTDRAREAKIEGEVLMECVVRADGKTDDFRIVRSLDADLDQAAIDAAKQWEFAPGTRRGKPVDVLVAIAIAFTLK